VHVRDSLCDLTHSERGDCGWPIGDALARIDAAGSGVVVILRHDVTDEDLISRVQGYAREDAGENHAQPPTNEDLRTYGVGAQILLDLGVRKMRVLSAPKRLHGISGFGLEVVEYVS
jgi:3,4-dihydroxy 2-butanone 4-phosphate synthase/GTP cyclohydrolase II